MVKESITIRIPTDFETRPIAMLVQVAGRFDSRITLESGSKCVNAKSIMGMMSLGLDNGETVEVSAEGDDEKEALAGIREYLTRGESKD